MKNLFLFVVAILFAASVFAQAPEQFNYQAVLRDAGGNVVASASKTLVVNVLQTSSSGASVYQETHTVTTTPQGVVNLKIGGGTVNSGVFANINWGTNNYFIKVTVDGVDISAGQLLSVPYALYAKNSGNATMQVITQDQRDALTTTTGLIVLNTTTNKLNVYNGTTWLNYDGSSAATVKLDPTITWANPANIVDGTALSATQLNATASVAGNYIYTPPIGTVLSVGATQNLKVDFTPTDAIHYNTATKTVTITVIAKTTPTITWANPANITVGTALSATQLNAIASVAGAYVYTPAIGTVLTLGDAQNLKVDFTPTDAANYTTATKTVTINVKAQTTPTITWANPANITVGTALSATQLNATAGGVAGTYVYTPAIGTVLALGDNQNLKVDFTPTDAANYTTATKTVTINVKAVSLVLGQTYQGGIIVYFLKSGDPGYDANVQHGLIAAPSDQSTSMPWQPMNNGTFPTVGTTSQLLGTGQANSSAINNTLGVGDYAARTCLILNLNGYNYGWYLPSKNELTLILQNANSLPNAVNFAYGSYYWTSSEMSNTNAYAVGFSNSAEAFKTDLYRVRAIRSF